MGVDVKILVDGRANIRDVADVVGILGGLKPYRQDFSSGSGWSTQVDGVSYESCENIPECAQIIIKGELIDGEKNHQVLWHWEPGDDDHVHLMMPRSTPFWVAIGKGVVDFFGGKLDYNDCDDIECDYSTPGRVRTGVYAEDGEGWERLQQAKLDLKQLTQKDLEEANKVSSYKLEDMC